MSSLTEPMKTEQTKLLSAPLKTQAIETKPAEDVNQSPCLVTGTKMEEKILKEYDDKYSGPHKKPIITKKGEPYTYPLCIPSQRHLVQSSIMKPMSNKYYRVSNINSYNVLVLIIIVMNEFFDETDLALLACTNKDLCKVVPEICCLLKVDWHPLLKPCIGYQDQTENDPHIFDMATSLLIMVGLDQDKVVCILKDEYIGSWRHTKII